MKKLLSLAILLASTLFFVACTDDDGDDNPTPEPNPGEGSIENLITENISGDVTWSGDSIYILGGRITILDGASLTIEPGTIIKGQAGTGANATAMLVARGGQIFAEGSATAPIIFTSVADEIQPGSVASPNLDPDLDGLWGGIIVLGRAPISADAEAVQIEGIPPSDQNGLYGGNDPEDNSGVLSYVSIRHGGANIGEGNEINGLTLGGVGSGTQIDHIEIVANQDDGIEPFGGSVNVSDIIVWGQGDDAYDCDQAYTGTISNFIFIGGPNSDHGMELDGPEGSATGSFTLENGSLKGYNEDGVGGGEYVDLRSDVTCTIRNCYFFNFSADSDVELDNQGVKDNYLAGNIVMEGLEFNISHLSGVADANTTIDAIFVDKTDAGDAFATQPLPASIQIVTSPSAGVGADASVFAGWTWADSQGQLADF